jgi:hypothetical protein
VAALSNWKRPVNGPPRRIVGFHQDAEDHWVAELECDPPWQNRPWVQTPEGRAQALGQSLGCPLCATSRGA